MTVRVIAGSVAAVVSAVIGFTYGWYVQLAFIPVAVAGALVFGLFVSGGDE